MKKIDLITTSNTQIIDQQLNNKTYLTHLPVMEHFYTLQGEGRHSGSAAYFIRLAGCNVGCTWCDVKESWDMQKYPNLPISYLVHKAKASGTKIAVITGGEPLMHNLNTLCAELHNVNIFTHLETSGSYPLSGNFNWICLSPKKFKPPLNEVIEQANELKIVVFNKNDFNWAEKYAEQVPANCCLFLQPEFSKASELTPLIIDYIKQHPNWKLSLQIHKYLNIP